MKPTLFLACAAALLVCSCAKRIGFSDAEHIVYVETNDYHTNSNAVLGYRVKHDGTLEALPGSPYWTHGAGLSNPTQALGPDDNDQTIVISPDGRYLLAVNGGSNTVAVFQIGFAGSLAPVPGSPFPSGGQTPCSVAVNGDFVYVANKSQNALATITELPNYCTFHVDASGHLTEIPGGKVEVPAGSAPSQVLVSNDRHFVFATDFLAFMLPTEPATGTLVSLQIGNSGALQQAPGSPYVVPEGDGGALGLWQSPTSSILYSGLPVASAFAVYAINDWNGSLKFVTSVSAGPATCWLRTNRQGDRLYTLNSGENSVSIFNTASPASPWFLSKLVLKDPGPGVGAKMSPSSGDFSLGFSPDGKYLFVVSQNTNPNFTLGNFNYLHVLSVASDGSLTEPGDPLQLPVDADVRPQGVATL